MVSIPKSMFYSDLCVFNNLPNHSLHAYIMEAHLTCHTGYGGKDNWWWCVITRIADAYLKAVMRSFKPCLSLTKNPLWSNLVKISLTLRLGKTSSRPLINTSTFQPWGPERLPEPGTPTSLPLDCDWLLAALSLLSLHRELGVLRFWSPICYTQVMKLSNV